MKLLGSGLYVLVSLGIGVITPLAEQGFTKADYFFAHF